MQLLSFDDFLKNKLITEASFDNSSGDNYWGDTASGVLPICRETKRLLINHRSRHVNEPNTWGIWGGAIHSDISPEENALLEMEEECGYNGHIDLIPSYIFQTPSKSFTYYNFIGLLDNEFKPILDWESQGYKWVELSELLTMDNLHFGLIGLLKNNLEQIKEYTSKEYTSDVNLLREFNQIHRSEILDNENKFTIAYELELKSSKAFNTFQDLDKVFKKQYGHIIKKYDMVTEYDYTIDNDLEKDVVNTLSRSRSLYEYYDSDMDFSDNIGDIDAIIPRIKGIEMKNRKYFKGINEAFNFLDEFYEFKDNKFKQVASTGTHVNIGFYKPVVYNILKGYLLLNEDFSFKGFEHRKGSEFTGSYRDKFNAECLKYFKHKYNGNTITHLDIKENFTTFEDDLNKILITMLSKMDEKKIGFNFNKLKENYIEFRYPGGNLNKQALKDQTLHYCNIVYLCCEPEYRRRDYIIKLTNFITNLIVND